MDCPDILDFEASGFGPDSYPIEVGYSLVSGERFCALIRPHESWDFWDFGAEAVHGISRGLLQTRGSDVRQVCRELNRRLQGRTLYSDAWVVDKNWCNRLFETAGMLPAFHLSAIENVQSECQYLIWDGVREKLLLEQKAETHRHRASVDADFIQKVFRQTRQMCRRPS
jgi:hypothetical protein